MDSEQINQNRTNKNNQQTEITSREETKLIALESMYNRVNQKMTKEKIYRQDQISAIKEQLSRMEENLKVLRKTTDRNTEKEHNNFQIIEKKMQSTAQVVKEDLKAVKKGLIQNMDKKYKTMKEDAFSTLQEDFQSLSQQHSLQLQQRIDELYSVIENEQNTRNETAQFLIGSFGEEIIKLEELISEYKNERLEGNDKVMKAINEMEEQIEGFIQEEEREGQNSRDQIQKRLEEVCYRIEMKILGK